MNTQIKINEKQYKKLAEKLEQAIYCQVDYECTHEDAGGNYAHLPREGGWSYSNGDERLKSWLKENNLPMPKDWDRFTDDVLDWCNIEPGHIFSNPEGQGKFTVDSYPVGEVEDQYCLYDLAALLEVDPDTTVKFAAMAMDDNRFCLRENGDGGLLSYTNTDAAWFFTIDKQWAKDQLENE